MSTATVIEIAPGASALSLGSTRLPARTHSTGLAAADASSPAAAASFRSSWQSLLASLGAGLDEASGDEAGTSATSSSTEAALAKTAGRVTPASVRQTTAIPLPVGAGRTQKTGVADTVAGLSETGSRSGVSALTTAPASKRQSTAVQTETNTAKAHAAESAIDTHSARKAKLETAGTMEQVSAVPESPSQFLSASVQPATIAAPSGAKPVLGTANLRASEAAPAMPFGWGDAASGKTSRTASAIGAISSQAANPVGESGLSGKETSVSATEAESEAPQVGEAAHKGSAAEGALSSSALRESAPASETASSLATRSSQGSTNSGVHSAASDLSPAPIAASADSGNETAPIGKGEASLAQIPVRAAFETQLQSLPSSNNQAQNPGTETLAATAGGEVLQAAALVADTAKSQSSPSPATSSIGKRQGAASAGHTAEQATSRSTQLTGTLDPMQHNGLSAAGQSGVAAQDGAGLVRDPSAGHGAVGTTGHTAGESAAAASNKDDSASSETFSALDAGSPATPTWIHAGAQRAEAGFEDPALGWVGVRADASGGSIHASLVAGSTDAAQTLSGHLAGLNAYLADQHTPVMAVTMAATEDRSVPYGADQNLSQNMNQGTGQDGSRGQHPVPAVSEPALPSAASAVSAARTEGSAPGGSLGGTHISLIA
jgi:hypothetical protein